MTPNRPGGTSTKPPVLDLDALVKPVGRIKRFGKEHDVMPIDGVSQSLFEQLTDRHKAGEQVSLTEQSEIGAKIIAQLLPTMDAEDRDRLSLEERLRVIQMAAKAIEQVQEFIEGQEGNGRRPSPKGRAAGRSQ